MKKDKIRMIIEFDMSILRKQKPEQVSETMMAELSGAFAACAAEIRKLVKKLEKP